MPDIIQLPQNGGNQNGGMILPVANGGGRLLEFVVKMIINQTKQMTVA